METYDIIIVGAGPAGSTAAYYLGNAGKRVLIVDKSLFPRDKACGGGLLNTRDWADEFENYRNIESKLDRYPCYSAGAYVNKTFLFKVDNTHFFDHIERKEFDNLLLEEALKRKDVEFRNFEVQEISRNGELFILSDGQDKIAGKFIIGADGANSIVSKFLKNKSLRLNAVGNCLEYSLECEKKSKTIFLFLGFNREIGYAWIFPTAQGYYVGLGYVRKTRKSLESNLNDFIAACVKEKLMPKDYRIIKKKGGLIPVQVKKNFCLDNVFLCGDALGLVSQWNGEGIYFAMKSGKIAARLLKSGNASDLKRKYEKEIKPLIKATRIIRWIPPRFLTIPFWFLITTGLRITMFLGIKKFLRFGINRLTRRFNLPDNSRYKKF